MARHRSRMQIIAEILKLADGGILQTRLTYGAYLSGQQMAEYLALLVARRLIELKGKEWHTTDQGRKFLRAYDGTMSLLEV